MCEYCGEEWDLCSICGGCPNCGDCFCEDFYDDNEDDTINESGVCMTNHKPVSETAHPEGIGIQFTGNNCISLLRWTGHPHWDNLELHATDNPYVYIDGAPVLMEKGDWVIREDDGKLHILKPVSSQTASAEGDGWIAVTERLPKKGVSVDLWVTGEAATVTFYDTSLPRNATSGRTTAWKWDGQRWCATGGLQYFLSPAVTPTHWRPLPAPPVNEETK